MNLLLRLYPVQDGKIFIGGEDINNIDLAKLRSSISYITQDNFLFSSTIKDNISLFRDEFQDKEIEESTEKSMISGEIEKMKNGINTVIGELRRRVQDPRGLYPEERRARNEPSESAQQDEQVR